MQKHFGHFTGTYQHCYVASSCRIIMSSQKW